MNAGQVVVVPPPWTPALLFANGEQGAWYDFSDLSTLFQDDACTVPVTTTGDPVGCILDKSRNGNGLIQTTADNRPVYQSDGVNRWLQFDVTNDGFSTGSGSSSSGCGVSWLLAVWVRARAESLT